MWWTGAVLLPLDDYYYYRSRFCIDTCRAANPGGYIPPIILMILAKKRPKKFCRKFIRKQGFFWDHPPSNIKKFTKDMLIIPPNAGHRFAALDTWNTVRLRVMIRDSGVARWSAAPPPRSFSYAPKFFVVFFAPSHFLPIYGPVVTLLKIFCTPQHTFSFPIF